MSVAQIIAELPRLNAADRQLLSEFLRQLELGVPVASGSELPTENELMGMAPGKLPRTPGLATGTAFWMAPDFDLEMDPESHPDWADWNAKSALPSEKGR